MRRGHVTHLRRARVSARLIGLASLVAAAASCSSGGGGVASADGASTTTASVVPTTVAPTTTVPEPVCSVPAMPGDSLTAIAERNGLTLEQLEEENLLDRTDVFLPGQLFDVCLGDTVDPADPTLVEPVGAAVMIQQRELNELFANSSLEPLAIDGDSGRLKKVLQAAADLGGWGTPAPEGRARGIAGTIDVGTAVAMVAEVSIDQTTGKIRVHKVSAAMDCGLTVNPDGATAQVEGNVMWGVGSALLEEMTVQDGQVVPANFDKYPLLTMKEAPA